MHSFETYERLIKLSVLIALAVLFIVAALSLLTGCGEEDLEAELPIIDIEDFPDSDWYYHYKLVAREPLPYSVTVGVVATYKGFSANADGYGGSFAIEKAGIWMMIHPETNTQHGTFPKVMDNVYCDLYNAWPFDWDKNNHDPEWRGIVTSIDVEISVYIHESEKNNVYTVGQSTLTLDSR